MKEKGSENRKQNQSAAAAASEQWNGRHQGYVLSQKRSEEKLRCIAASTKENYRIIILVK